MKSVKTEKDFDINIVLMTVYSALETIREEREIELIYDMDSTVPKELRGDADALGHLLTHFLRFVIKHSDDKNVILYISAPDDFLYMEEIRFEVDTSTTNINAPKAHSFFQSRLKALLDRMEGTAEYDEKQDRMVLHIPFKLKDLGNRRYYRLPDIRMLGKKVLLICQNKRVAVSLKKMFKYFLYEVDEGAEEYKQRGSNLAFYDIFVLDRALLNDGILDLVYKVQRQQDLKFIVLDEPNYVNRTAEEKGVASAYLIKPVLQESIYDLIVALYEEDSKTKRIRMEEGKPVIDMENYIDEAFRRSEEVYLHMHENDENEEEMKIEDALSELERYPVLDTVEGEAKASKVGRNYRKALEQFIEKFNRSDYYFREIAKGHAEWQIKEFAQDLEKEGALIGAERLAKLAQHISMVYVYKQWDKMERYVNRYHIELKKLIIEITHFLKGAPKQQFNPKRDKMTRF